MKKAGFTVARFCPVAMVIPPLFGEHKAVLWSSVLYFSTIAIRPSVATDTSLPLGSDRQTDSIHMDGSDARIFSRSWRNAATLRRNSNISDPVYLNQMKTL